jgi:hypothetical protein
MKPLALALAATVVMSSTVGVLAHHGWVWAEDQTFELTGVIRDAKLGNPHGLLTVESGGEMWTVEVGQPWRNERAGLTEDKLMPGVELVASGHRSSDPAMKLMKAERITIEGTLHNLYPDRD